MSSLDRMLRELAGFDAHGAGVLSTYLHTDPAAGGAGPDAELDRMAGALAEDLDETQRRRLQEELAAVRDYLGSMIAPPVSVALFTCTPLRFFRVIRLPVRVSSAAYWASWPQVRTLREALARMPGSRSTTGVAL